MRTLLKLSPWLIPFAPLAAALLFWRTRAPDPLASEYAPLSPPDRTQIPQIRRQLKFFSVPPLAPTHPVTPRENWL